MTRGTPFEDREDAGRRLVGRLTRYGDEDPIVLALPRDGVPVGYEISRALNAPLDVFLARKLGAPGRKELGIGAVAQGGLWIINEEIVRRLKVPKEYVNRVADEEIEEINRRLTLLRGDRPEPEMRGRTAILVDDGIATGVTAYAAVQALRRRDPRRVVLAVPVCAEQTAELLRPQVDELVSRQTPSNLMAISLWYRDFEQVTDEEVIELLKRARSEQEENGATGPNPGT